MNNLIINILNNNKKLLENIKVLEVILLDQQVIINSYVLDMQHIDTNTLLDQQKQINDDISKLGSEQLQKQSNKELYKKTRLLSYFQV
jgi:hypothetical protein